MYLSLSIAFPPYTMWSRIWLMALTPLMGLMLLIIFIYRRWLIKNKVVVIYQIEIYCSLLFYFQPIQKQYKSISLMYLARKQSQMKGMSIDQKILSSQILIKLIEYQENFNFVQTLFGFSVGSINTSLNQKFVFELKKKFSMIQELYFNKALEKEAVTQIVIDSIQSYKKTQGLYQKQQKMLQVISQSLEECMINPTFITQKWHRQALIEEQNKQNELAFKKFLEEEMMQNKKMAEQKEAEGWQCQVCLTQIDRNNFGLLQCSHIFHSECISAYLKTKIQASELDIKCPMEGCGILLQVGDIYQFVDADLKQKFQKFSFNKFIEQNNSSTAWCPTAGCSAAFEFDQALDNYKCPACNKHYCLKCRCIFHSGMTCAEYRVSNSFDKNDEDFIQFVNGAKFKQCPKCNFWVQRSDGCCTMTCKCGQQFCYSCGGTECPHGMCSYAEDVPVPLLMPVARPPRRPAPNVFQRLGRPNKKKR